MEISASPPVITKLKVPVIRERLISRGRLLDLLHAQENCRLILLCAPAGYGKTTLLADWARSLIEGGTGVIWYALDAGDDDPISFNCYLVSSLIQTLGPLPELTQLAQLLRTSPAVEMKYVISIFLNAFLSSEQNYVFVFDDYHLINSPIIHEALAYMIEYLPENLRIAISSRMDPALPLARMRARGQLCEIRLTDLQFTMDETAKFLNELMQLDLSPRGVAALEEHTEGWVTGLQLAALSLKGCTDKDERIDSFSGSHRYLVEYLMEEVINRQSKEVQEFLTSTSILDRLNAPLCSHILNKKPHNGGLADVGISADSSFRNSQEILEYLERSNLFLVALDEERNWYRYHHLFREFLHERLKKRHPQQIPAMHKAACEWLVNNAFIHEAASQAFQTSDWEFAASFAEEHNFTLITHSDLSTVYEWCSQFPEAIMQKHPILGLQQAISLAFTFSQINHNKIEARLQQADQAMNSLGDRKLTGELFDMVTIVRTFIAFTPDLQSDPHELLRLAQSMSEHPPVEDASQFSIQLLKGYAYLALQNVLLAEKSLESARQIALRANLYFGYVESTFHLARLFHSRGLLRRAAELCREGRAEIVSRIPHPEKDLPALGILDIALGCILLERNEVNDAAFQIRTGFTLMGGGMNPYYMLMGYLALFRLSEIQSQSADAFKYLDELEAVWPDISFFTSGLRAVRQIRDARKPAVSGGSLQRWCERYSAAFSDDDFIPGMGPYGAAEIYYQARLVWAQAQIAAGNPASARHYLKHQFERAKAQGLTQRMIELSLLEALASDAEGNNEQVRTSMEYALDLAQSEGFLLVFDQFHGVSRILEKMALHSRFREYIDQIMTALGSFAYHGKPKTNRGFYGQILSEREMEVLQLIARGATNQEIAGKLFVTVGTVKSHVNHILKKLDSHNRTEIVAKARQLGML